MNRRSFNFPVRFCMEVNTHRQKALVVVERLNQASLPNFAKVSSINL
jgi:hypothetical protein